MSTTFGRALPAPERGPNPTKPGTAAFIRRHPLGAFFAWFFTVGQALAFTPVVFDTGLPHQVFIIASTLIGLLLPALVITRIVDGPAGLRALWQRAVHWRVSLAWYALAMLVLPLVAIGIVVALLGMPTRLSAPVLVSALAGNLLLPLLLTFTPNNWWEEVAWQGFVQARLQSRRGPVLAAVLTAPLFALQHISLTVGNSVAGGALVMVVLTAFAIPFRFLLGWMDNRTGSLLLVGLIHGIGDAVAGGSGFQDGFLARLYPEQDLAGVAHILAYALLGLIVVAVTKGLLGTARPGADAAAVAPASTGVR